MNISEKKVKKAEKIMRTATEDSIAEWPVIPQTLETGQLIILCRRNNNKLYFTFGAVQSCVDGLHLIKVEGPYGHEFFTAWNQLINAKYCIV